MHWLCVSSGVQHTVSTHLVPVHKSCLSISTWSSRYHSFIIYLLCHPRIVLKVVNIFSDNRVSSQSPQLLYLMNINHCRGYFLSPSLPSSPSSLITITTIIATNQLSLLSLSFASSSLYPHCFHFFWRLYEHPPHLITDNKNIDKY